MQLQVLYAILSWRDAEYAVVGFLFLNFRNILLCHLLNSLYYEYICKGTNNYPNIKENH